MATTVSVLIGDKRVTALMAQETQLVVDLVQNLQLCPFRLATWTDIFLPLFLRDGIALNILVDTVYPPLDCIHRGAIIDIVIGPVYGTLLALFCLRSGMSV